MTDDQRRAALQLAIAQERALLQEAYHEVRGTMHRVASPSDALRKLRPALPLLAAGLGFMLLMRTRRHGIKAALIVPAIELWHLWQQLSTPSSRPLPALASAAGQAGLQGDRS